MVLSLFLSALPSYAEGTIPFEDYLDAYIFFQTIDQSGVFESGVEVGAPQFFCSKTLGAGGISSSVMAKPPRAIDQSSDRASLGLLTVTTVTGLTKLAGGNIREERKYNRLQKMLLHGGLCKPDSYRRLVEHLEEEWRLVPIMNEQLRKNPPPELALLPFLQAKVRNGPVSKIYRDKERNRIIDLTVARILLSRLRAVRSGPEVLGQFEEDWKKYEAGLEETSNPKQTLKLLDAILLRMEGIGKPRSSPSDLSQRSKEGDAH